MSFSQVQILDDYLDGHFVCMYYYINYSA